MKIKQSIGYKIMASLLTVSMLGGCATIVGQSSPETLNLRSNPDQASISIVDESGTKIFEGKTPTTVSLEKKKGFFSGKTFTVTIVKEGFTDHTVTVDTRVNGWYIGGNLVFGGLIGWLIVDPATGAMWTLDTNEVNVNLDVSKHVSILEHNQANIVLLQDVPLSLKDKMVRVTY